MIKLLKLFIKKEIDREGLDRVKYLIIKAVKDNKKISIRLFLLRYRFFSPDFNNYFWRNFIFSISKKNRNIFQNNTINFIKSINGKDLNMKDLKIVYLISLRTGLYTIAFHLREKIIEKIYSLKKIKKMSQSQIINLLCVYFEKNDYKYAKNLIKRITTANIKDLFAIYFNKFSDQGFIKISENNIVSSSYSKDFISILEKKRIVINSPSTYQDYSNLKENDLLIAMNFFNGKNKKLKIKYDISYISYEQSIHNFGNIRIDKNLNYVITRNKESCELFSRNYKNKVRYSSNFKPLLLNGNFNLMPNLILDILLCPSRIKEIFIINSDLMVTSKRIDNYYPKSWKWENKMKENFLKNMTSHDPITNYIFLKNCFDKKLIKGDLRFKKILQNGLESYLIQIEKVYGIFI